MWFWSYVAAEMKIEIEAISCFAKYNTQKSNKTLTMHLIVLPAQALCNSDTTPLFLLEQSESTALVRVKELLRYHLEKRLRKDDMPVLVVFI